MELFEGLYILLALCVSCLFASVVIPNVLVVSFKKKLFDVPDARKVHTSIVPRLGGVAFTPIIVFTMSFVITSSLLGFVEANFDPDSINMPIFGFGLCSLIMLYLVGLKDDLVGVSYSTKFVIQIACGTLMVISGLRVEDLHGFLFFGELHPVMSYLTTIFLVVFIVNAINLIDGIDGLASGLSIIALIYYGTCFAVSGNVLCSMLAFTTVGTLVPFFYYNVFGSAEHCRKIFMGDTGALTVGFILAFLSIKMLSISDFGNGNHIFISFAPLIVPCFDVVRVAVFRISHGNHPFKPDRNHIHHKFLDTGLSHRMSLVSILLVSLTFTLPMIWLSRYVNVNVMVIVVLALWMALNFVLDRFKREER